MSTRETKRIDPRNLTAQIHHRSTGNPSSTLPRSAISNCFPGLEMDFRNLWRRTFVGIVLHESNNYVVAAEDDQYKKLIGHRLLRVDGRPTVTNATGPQTPDGESRDLPSSTSPGVVFLEWSNSLAGVLQKAGQKVLCEFTLKPENEERPIPAEPGALLGVELEVRRFFDEGTAALNKDLLNPGELTQGLCSPWQNDYRECACYYWAASRPDYVNVEPTADGGSRGDNWIQKARGGEYVLDDRRDARMLSYDDLFERWEKELHFIVEGRDVKERKAP